MRLNDAIVGAALLIFGAALAFWSQSFPAIPGQQYGAAVFPTLVAAGFAVCGLLMIASGLRQGGPAIAWADWAHEGHGLRNVAITVAAILFYILASDTLGFILTMAPILLVMFRLLGVGWFPSIGLAILVTLAVQYVFGSFLYVPLPWGVLTPIRWW
ncbi:MAG: tripartite tricarboxylate transporter TctB family protein [Rhizobiales bacterium]|nr:tripartite tricarboxylate transporter TctB family protein [Hyphomicrobiales bacterium]